ncbi:MAG: MoaD/ThiS family protein [Propionibacteriaceae bacterium]|nr:MoaD/ThiS family protein [Micropruina sp.]HBX81579.1 molybdopterin synthase sulfur carrier subunit [Propionibacteriaceae bacterium]HBY22414.1 molybdopterin synthase sulfur carrier subunit [Propionibacteriaceae bacterium]
MEIRFYAGAADAAGTTTATLQAGDLTPQDLVHRLADGNPDLARVLACCSLLVDGRPVQDATQPILASSRVDVLPPFAGG